MTPENQLTEDLVEHWIATPPTDLPGTWNIYHHENDTAREKPAIIIGYESAARVPGQPDTKRVGLRVMILTNLDDETAETHREIAGVMEEALAALGTKPGPLPLTYIHDLLRESPETGVDERDQFTVLKRTAIISLLRETP